MSDARPPERRSHRSPQGGGFLMSDARPPEGARTAARRAEAS